MGQNKAGMVQQGRTATGWVGVVERDNENIEMSIPCHIDTRYINNKETWPIDKVSDDVWQAHTYTS